MNKNSELLTLMQAEEFFSQPGLIGLHFMIHKINFSNKCFIFLLLNFFLISIPVKSQNYWNEIVSPTPNFLHTQFFTDSLSGWIAGDSGAVFYTSDGGESWIQQESRTTSNIKDIFFVDKNKGWAIGWIEGVTPSGSDIISTSNGGVDWSERSYPEDNVYLTSIIFFDSLNGWAGGYPNKLVHTTNGGASWNNAVIDSGTFSNFPVIKIKFYNSLYGFACGGAIDFAGVIWRTTNGGNNWSSIGVSAEPIRDIYYLDSLNILGIGGDPEFFGAGSVRTSDGGENWEYKNLGFFGVATALSFRTQSECWAPLSFAETIIRSTDSGENWESFPAPGNSKIYKLAFTDSLTGYGVGFEGKVIKYKKHLITNLSEQEDVNKSFILYQNYPNPFNPTTRIKYHISKPMFVSLRIYDVLGNEIATLVDEEKPAGDFEVKFNISRLNNVDVTSGIYFYKLQAGDFISTKKMILLK